MFSYLFCLGSYRIGACLILCCTFIRLFNGVYSRAYCITGSVAEFQRFRRKANETRMVVHGQLVEPTVCLSDPYDVFLLDIVRDKRHNLWTMIYRSL